MSNEINWSIFDFALIGFLLVSTGLLFVLVLRITTNTGYRVALGIILAAVLLLTWAELAVGVFGSPFAGS